MLVAMDTKATAHAVQYSTCGTVQHMRYSTAFVVQNIIDSTVQQVQYSILQIKTLAEQINI